MGVLCGTKPGIKKLSQLEIDTDKDWQRKGISNIKEVAEGMAVGDVIQHDGVKLVKLSPSVANYVLTSQGPEHLVVWAPGGTYFYRYFPVSIASSQVEGVVTPEEILKAIALGSQVIDTQIPTKQPAMASSRLVEVVTPKDISKTISPATQTVNELNHLMGGAVADDGGVQTDETAPANNDIANDMHLLPAVPAVNDAYYFGDDITFGRLRLIISTAGAGIWNFTWEYWNGSAWAAVSDLSDPSNCFRNGGTQFISWTVPGDWALTTIQGMNLYWLRARITDYTSVTTQPLGQRSWTVTAA